METQIRSYIATSTGVKTVNIFGYATKGVPGLEINGVGKLSKNIKEKLIYLTRTRKMKLPTKRFVICVDINDLDGDIPWCELKWLEFPILLAFWHLASLLPIRKLDDCLCAGWISSKGDIFQSNSPAKLRYELLKKLSPVEVMDLKLITFIEDYEGDFYAIDSAMLFEHITNINFKLDYIDNVSAIPIKSFMA